MKKEHIYLLGIFGLGLVHPAIEELSGGKIFFVAVMLCLVIILAWVAGRFGQ